MPSYLMMISTHRPAGTADIHALVVGQALTGLAAFR
jgi:hypothetical protein